VRRSKAQLWPGISSIFEGNLLQASLVATDEITKWVVQPLLTARQIGK
jgi:hypothetical protein